MLMTTTHNFGKNLDGKGIADVENDNNFHLKLNKNTEI